MLFLLVLGAASVKAQVRIGGNAAPNASAVLDLNANDTNNGTKGLALPRVGLTSNTMLLPGVTSNLTGMLVYNTTTTGGAGVNTIGIYFWNGATWVKASLPSTSAADSGLFLMSNGSTWLASPRDMAWHTNTDSVKRPQPATLVTWYLILDPVINIDFSTGAWTRLVAPGFVTTDVCFDATFSAVSDILVGNGFIGLHSWHGRQGASAHRIRCYRPSL